MHLTRDVGSPVVEVTGGNLSLAGRPVLRGIDVSVRQGEVVAVLGANGSGKSTLIRGLMGLVPWTSGEVRLFGTAHTHFRDWKRIGYVPQQANVDSGVPATVIEVVSSGRLARRRLLLPMRAADKEAVQAALHAVELEDRQHDAVSELSGGQQQRVLIARALAGDPEMLVLDEPNAGVDHHNQVGLAATLRPRVVSGATVLLVLHEIGPLAELIDRVVVIRDGRVTYDGQPPGDDSLDEFHTHHHRARGRARTPLGKGGPL
ncbi:MAG: metal ABC transporter ATP-binding protein [Nocardioidaceae bacterium]